MELKRLRSLLSAAFRLPASICSLEPLTSDGGVMQEASQVEPPDIPPWPARPRHRRTAAAWLSGAALVLLALMVAGAVVLERSSEERQPFYTGMPAPCTMVLQPTMRIRNGAEPSGGLVQTSAQKQTGTCYWIALTSKGHTEILELEVDLYRSAERAQQAYDSNTQAVPDNWAPSGVTASAQALVGLGDQAIGQISKGVPQTGETTAEVWVRSGNADVWIAYYSGDWTESTAGSAEIQSVTAMAGHVLAVLRKGRAGTLP